jgi:hypothetical protein
MPSKKLKQLVKVARGLADSKGLEQKAVELGRAKKADKPLGGQAAKLNRAAKTLGT